MGFYSDLMGYEWDLPSGYVKIVDLPILNGDFPVVVNVYQWLNDKIAIEHGHLW